MKTLMLALTLFATLTACDACTAAQKTDAKAAVACAATDAALVDAILADKTTTGEQKFEKLAAVGVDLRECYKAKTTSAAIAGSGSGSAN